MTVHDAARPALRVLTALSVLVALSAGTRAQEPSMIYLLALDAEGMPILEIEPADIAIREDAGESLVLDVVRFGWPIKLTVLVDNGQATRDWLVHYRSGLKKLFAGLPPNLPVSLITTAPNPRWLVRETTDRIQIQRAVDRITPDDSLGRFSDALVEYALRLDAEFRTVEDPLPPYLPVLVSIATTSQDGSLVRRDDNARMITSLRTHRVWTHMVMIAPGRGETAPQVSANPDGTLSLSGGVSGAIADEGQNGEIAKAVQEYTGGTYVPITGSGTSSLNTSVLPDLARRITLRYIRQMTQHRVVFARAAGASGPMKNFSFRLRNHPGSRILVSTDGSMP